MSRKLNCWEFKNCGREKNGLFVNSLGECPVASAFQFDGANEGTAGGRACWRVQRGSQNRLTGIASITPPRCLKCEFYRRVRHEESVPEAIPEVAVPVA